ncbi:hypothetical protein GOZ96_04715 [Agrobacterium vitis]|uniref:hypothetical protein n=1 Tax=Agrobacterium vitis TaxID=373 RepID=UPI00122FC685|nr:hypothetical protein [Agrobacterium vitis]MUZ95891.1 hypothetical protein [Agrobacterium vitis]
MIGGLIGGAGSIAQGAAANQQAKQQALNMEAQGKQELASSQQQAFQQKEQGNLMLSKQQALSAASGGGADDPTILKIMGDTAQQSAVNVRNTTVSGQQAMANANSSASNMRKQGQASFLGSVFNAAGSMAKTTGKYGTQKGWFS